MFRYVISILLVHLIFVLPLIQQTSRKPGPIKVNFLGSATVVGGKGGPVKKTVLKTPPMQKKIAKGLTKIALAATPQVIATGTGGGSKVGAGDGAALRSGDGSSNPKAEYINKINSLIASQKQYPAMARRLGHEGKVLMNLTLDKSGKLLNLELVEKSRFTSLNEASMKMVKEVDLFPAIPDEVGVEKISFQVPVNYKLF